MRRSILFVAVVLASCGNKKVEETKNQQKVSDTATQTARPAAPKTINPSSAPALLGKWAKTGENEETFEIKKTTIFYPNHPMTVSYKIVGDSIRLEVQKGLVESFAFKLTAPDTLTMVTSYGSKGTYYRMK